MKFLINFWQKGWWSKIILIFLGLFILGTIISLLSPQGQESYKAGQQSGKEAAGKITQPTTTPTPTVEPSPTPSEKDTYLKELFEKMVNVGPDRTAYVTTNNGHIQAIKQEDGTWIVTKIVNNWPEIFAGTSVKNVALEFISAMYHSNYPVKQVGVTITSSESTGKYFRAFLGANQAKLLKEEDWKMGPSNFYNWLKDVETSRNESDRANRTVVEDNL